MERIESIVDERSNGERLDRFLASIRPDVSRSLIQREIREGNVQVAGSAVHRTAHRLRSGEVIAWTLLDTSPLSPAPIPLSILFEDDALLALDKPADLVVHPGAGTHKTTLVEGLLATRNLPPSDDPSRPGIVHRLDKGTSGIMVVAKTDRALESLKRQFAERMVAKSYLSIVEGTISEDVGTIDAPVGRDPASPSRMTVLPRGRPAQTEFQVLKRSENQTLLLVCPRTGRTHQIRTHLRYIGHPVVGDPVYGTRGSNERKEQHTPRQRDPCSEGTDEAAYASQGRCAFADRRTRMFLHAWRLVVRHPETGETLRFEAPPPSAFPAYHYGELPWQRIPEPPAE